MYQIKNGAVTLYLDMNYDGTVFELKGFTVDNDMNFYQTSFRSGDVDNDVYNRPCVWLEEYLLSKLKTLAGEQLKEYQDEHIHDMSIYTSAKDRFSCFWKNAGKEPDTKTSASAQYNRIFEGIISLEVNYKICLYDFINEKVSGYLNGYNAKEPLNTTIMEVFYKMYLDQLLALEQYKRGLAPPVYTELARLNQFLNGKKTVKLVMKDGKVHEYKDYHGNEVHIGGLLRLIHQDAEKLFVLENSYYIKPQFASCQPIDELDCLMYGKEKYYIDAAALRQFSVKEQ